MTKDRKEYNRQYYEAHKDYHKQYYEAHKDYLKQYYEVHKEEKKRYYKEYTKEYRKNNIVNPDGYTIYCYINKLNGKRYIGKTKQMLKYRKRDGYRTNKELNYILQKYGWDLFDTEILLSGLTKEEATHFEKKFIKIFNTTDKDYGYNKQVG